MVSRIDCSQKWLICDSSIDYLPLQTTVCNYKLVLGTFSRTWGWYNICLLRFKKKSKSDQSDCTADRAFALHTTEPGSVPSIWENGPLSLRGVIFAWRARSNPCEPFSVAPNLPPKLNNTNHIMTKVLNVTCHLTNTDTRYFCHYMNNRIYPNWMNKCSFISSNICSETDLLLKRTPETTMIEQTCSQVISGGKWRVPCL